MKLFGPDKQNDRATVRQTFLGSESGKRTLGMLLFELGYMSPAETEATQATKNFATNLIKTLADGDEEAAMGMIIDTLAGNFTYQPKPKQEDNK